MLQKYQEIYNEWMKKFKSNLKSSDYYGTKSFYLLNKEIFGFSGKKNKDIYQKFLNHYIIDEEKNFFLLDESTWEKIKSDYPNEVEVKINGIFQHNKFIFGINKYIYYFYFINDRQEINEGYFKLQDHNPNYDEIISMFYNLDINNFMQKMKIEKQKHDLQTIKYKNLTYFIKIKGKDIKNTDISKNKINDNIKNLNNNNHDTNIQTNNQNYPKKQISNNYRNNYNNERNIKNKFPQVNDLNINKNNHFKDDIFHNDMQRINANNFLIDNKKKK